MPCKPQASAEGGSAGLLLVSIPKQTWKSMPTESLERIPIEEFLFSSMPRCLLACLVVRSSVVRRVAWLAGWLAGWSLASLLAVSEGSLRQS